MKKLVNRVDDVLTEALRGFGAAHADLVRVHADPVFVTRAEPTRAGKVALISGGGSGHEPMHAGLVGVGMLDAACPGQVFTSPTPDQMLAAAQAVDSGAGVLFIVKNYEGDVMNFEMAAEMHEGRHATVLTNDDVAVEDFDLHHRPARRGRHGRGREDGRRRGRARRGPGGAQGAGRPRQRPHPLDGRGAHLLHRAGGRQADLRPRRGRDGDGRRHPRRARPQARRRSRPPTTSPRRCWAPSPATSAPGRASEVLLFVNGFGGTPLMELYLMYDAARRVLDGKGLPVARSLVGNYCTSLEMAGCSLTVTALDDELRDLWDAPVRTAALRW